MGFNPQRRRGQSPGKGCGSARDGKKTAGRHPGQDSCTYDSVAEWHVDDYALGITDELASTLRRSSRELPRRARKQPATERRAHTRRSDAQSVRNQSLPGDDSQEDGISVPLGSLDAIADAPRVALPPTQEEQQAAGLRLNELSESIEAPSLALNLGSSLPLPRHPSHASLSRATDKAYEDSSAFEAPSLALNLSGHSASFQTQNRGASPSRQTDASDVIDATSISISLNLPRPGNSASLPLRNSQAFSGTVNSRAIGDSSTDVLEAPSLRLSHIDQPGLTAQPRPLDPEINSHFSFPATEFHPQTPNTARADELNVSALAGEWMPLSPSPVHAAAFDGDAQLLRKLVYGIDSYKDLWTDRGTPLHFAVQGDKPDCVQILLDAGMDIDGENGDGITPLMQAAVMGHEQILILLLNRGASIAKAFLPGSSESLLHFCVEHEMVHGLKALLETSEGQLLAKKSRFKPIYTALTSLEGLCTSQQGSNPTEATGTPLSPGAIAAAATEPTITRARSVVEVLLEHSDLPENASYDDLFEHADQSVKALETLGGSSCEESFDWLPSPGNVSSMSPGGYDPESARASSRTSGRRVVFTPTANLDCSPANCSPLSVFGSERDGSGTPSAMHRNYMSQHSCGSILAAASEGSSPARASTAGLSGHTAGDSSSTRDTPHSPTTRESTPRVSSMTPRASVDSHGAPAALRMRQLRVRTRIPE